MYQFRFFGGFALGQVIVITSGKGGTGKTTACAAISSCLAALGFKTLAIDCDVGLRNLDISLGMSDFAVSDMADVTEGRTALMDSVHEHPKLLGLYFLSAPLYKPESSISQTAAAALFEKARECFDFVLVDSPAGIGSGFELAARDADSAIVVATANPASIRNAGRAVEVLEELGQHNIRLLINLVDKAGWHRYKTTIDDIIDAIGVRLIGIVRNDNAVPTAAVDEALLVLHSRGRAAHGFLDVARRLCGEELPVGI